VFFWDERLHCVCPEVVVELVHVHQGLEGFPAVTGLAKSSPSNLEFEGGSAIAAPTVSDDGLDDELLFVVLGHY